MDRNAQLDEALKIAAGIRHNRAVIARREDDIREYERVGLDNLVRLERNGLAAARAHLARYTEQARTTTNPDMERALRVYAITL